MTDENEKFSNMEHEILIDKLYEDPKSVFTGLADEIRDDLRNEFAQEMQNARIEKTYQDFAGKYPDFVKKFESGELDKFIGENKGHNYFSAFLTLTRDKKIQEAVDKKIKEKTPPPLESSQKSHGGTVRALADRFAERRRSGGSGGGGSSGGGEPGETCGLIPTL